MSNDSTAISMSRIGLAGIPGIAVLPTCSIVIMMLLKASTSSFFSSSNNCCHSGLCGTSSTVPLLRPKDICRVLEVKSELYCSSLEGVCNTIPLQNYTSKIMFDKVCSSPIMELLKPPVACFGRCGFLGPKKAEIAPNPPFWGSLLGKHSWWAQMMGDD